MGCWHEVRGDRQQVVTPPSLTVRTAADAIFCQTVVFRWMVTLTANGADTELSQLDNQSNIYQRTHKSHYNTSWLVINIHIDKHIDSERPLDVALLWLQRGRGCCFCFKRDNKIECVDSLVLCE